MVNEYPGTIIQLVRSPWNQIFSELLSHVRKDLLLASPYFTLTLARLMLAQLKQRVSKDELKVSFLTDVRPESALAGSLDLEAILELGRHFQKLFVTHLPSLHAKVYVADTDFAVITSANLTVPGIQGNLEYGIATKGRAIVRTVRTDFEQYASLGAPIEVSELVSIHEEIKELRKFHLQAQRTVTAKAAKLFRDKLETAKDQLLRCRVKGRTTHSIFSDTILFLLSKSPYRTVELHPLIQRLHPDLCDDSVDRVIDGVRFGKKWKHDVRTAQQHLKRQGLIWYDGERWHAVGSSGPVAG